MCTKEVFMTPRLSFSSHTCCVKFPTLPNINVKGLRMTESLRDQAALRDSLSLCKLLGKLRFSASAYCRSDCRYRSDQYITGAARHCHGSVVPLPANLVRCGRTHYRPTSSRAFSTRGECCALLGWQPHVFINRSA